MLFPVKRHKSVTLGQRFDQNLVTIDAKPILLHQLGLLLSLFALLPQLGMHHLVLVIKVLGEAARRHILDLTFEHLADGVSHLLEDVQEEHQLVLSLLPIRHVLVEFIDCTLQLLVLMEDFATFL